jgi:NADPH2:quinone reductase
MTKAIRVHEAGGPEVLRWEEVAVPAPGKGEIRVRHTAVGLNYIDVYHRTGLYPMKYPTVIGLEGAGTVTAVGPGVRDLKEGDRIAYTGAMGAYAEERVMPADKAIKLPDGIDDRTAAAIMLKGTTAQYLLRRTYKVKKGETILVHAAAGGVGLILCQWAKHLGCTVIGTVGSDEKAALARAHGCDHPIVYTRENFTTRVRELTGGAGVPVVYDAVGKDTWDGSLDCLRPLGLMVSYGNASGPVPPFSVLTLSQKGSLYLTRPTSVTYFAKRSDLVKSCAELFDVVTSGAVKIQINQTYPLSEAAQAHRDLEARKTTGSTVLLP